MQPESWMVFDASCEDKEPSQLDKIFKRDKNINLAFAEARNIYFCNTILFAPDDLSKTIDFDEYLYS